MSATNRPGYSAEDININSCRRVVIRKPEPEDLNEGIVLLLYPHQVLIAGVTRSVIALTAQEAANLASEIIKEYPLDALSQS